MMGKASSGFRSATALGVAIAVAALSLPPAAARAQESPPQDEARGVPEPTGFFTELLDVRVINVEVLVHDRSGLPVTGLEREDFELRVDGEPMPISNFYAESGGVTRDTVAPLEQRGDPSVHTVEEVEQSDPRRSYVVLMIDHTRLRANNRKRTLKALNDVIEQLSREDPIAVVGVEGGGSLVYRSDFLLDRGAIRNLLDDALRVSVPTDIVEAERRQIFGELTRGQSGGIQARASLAEEQPLLARIRAYAAQEYARSLRSLEQLETVVSTLAGVPGRKVLLHVGEGIPTRPGEGLYVEWINRFGGGSPDAEIGLRRFDFDRDYIREIGQYDLTREMQQVADAANRAGVTLYSIDAEGDHGGEVRSAAVEQGATSETLSVVDENFRAPLEFATRATGGRLLRSSGLLTEHLAEVVTDLDSFYSLGFNPPSDWDAGSDHDIEVRVEGRGLRVRHREKVALPAPDEREAGATLAALRYQAADNPLRVRATPGQPTTREDGIAVLPVALEIPIEKLGFLPRDGTQAGSLTLYVSTKGADGQASRVQKIPFHLAIPDEVMDQAIGDAARYELPLVVRPGDQQVAIGVRDNVSGIFSAVRVELSELTRSL